MFYLKGGGAATFGKGKTGSGSGLHGAYLRTTAPVPMWNRKYEPLGCFDIMALCDQGAMTGASCWSYGPASVEGDRLR